MPLIGSCPSLRPDAAGIARAAAALKAGQLVALPTETVYGLAARADDAQALAAIYAAKGRPAHNPLIVHVGLEIDSTWAMAEAGLIDWAQMTPAAIQTADALIRKFWPGPLTLILPRHPQVLTALSAGQSTLGLRQPAHPATLRVLALSGPVAMPSANRSNRISPTTVQHVLDELGKSLACVLDGGAARVGVESTIVAVLPSGALQCLRLGGLPLEALISAAPCPKPPEPALDLPSGAAPELLRAPGMLRVHYAPSTPLWRLAPKARLPARLMQQLEGQARPRLQALLLSGAAHLPRSWRASAPSADWQVRTLEGPEPDPTCVAGTRAAQQLYALLRQLDVQHAHAILVSWPLPKGGLWPAIGDRLLRASAPSMSPQA